MKEVITGILGIIAIVLLVACIAGVEWLVVCGLFKLICLCFTLVFSWKIATGIWLILVLLELFLKPSKAKVKIEK